MMACKSLRQNAKYLGNSLSLSQRKAAKDFAFLIDRVLSRLESRQSSLLSKAGKAVLIKSVVQAIPAYSMSSSKILSSICGNLDKFGKAPLGLLCK